MGHYICTVKATEGFGIPQGDVDRSRRRQERRAKFKGLWWYIWNKKIISFTNLADQEKSGRIW